MAAAAAVTTVAVAACDATPKPGGSASAAKSDKRKDIPIPVAPVIPFKSTGNDLRDSAEYAADRILAHDRGGDVAQTYAFIALEKAVYHGWQHPTVKKMIQRVEAKRNPDGGFGLSQESDAFGDGTFNPVDNTYTITSTEHVGRLYLAGVKAGAVPKQSLVRLVNAVLKLPRIKGGTCVAYSMSQYDAKGPCVYNVVAGVAWFLAEAKKLGVNQPGQDQLQAAMMATNNRFYNIATGQWPYQSTDKPGVMQDEAHNGVNVDALAERDPKAATAAAKKRAAAWKPASSAQFAWARVTAYDCASLARLGPGLVKEVQDPKLNTRTLVQAATFNARADAVCNLKKPLF